MLQGTSVLQKWLRDPMTLCLKGHLLDSGDPAGWAQQLILVEFQGSISVPEVQVPETAWGRIVDVHEAPAVGAGAIGVI